MSKLLAELNLEQRQVVETIHGPVLVLAGAGSGKTRALTHRVAYLLEQQLARPSEILAVTFTKKAAQEMKQRVQRLLPRQLNVPTAISTFHSLGARILREHTSHLPRTSHFTVCDAADSERLVRLALSELGLSPREWPPAVLRARISAAKNAGQTPEDVEIVARRPADEVLARVYPRYEALLAKHDAFDFDDLLLEPLKLLEREVTVRVTYQNRWRFISVDEYQDTNPPQDCLLKLLLGKEKNICVVGDDYQAIYSWRGAKVDHILRFEKEFPGCAVVYLTQNYRSTPTILEAANTVIAENAGQKHKKLWTAVTQGEPVQIVALGSDREEARFVRQAIERVRSDDGELNECVVLYRTNAQSRAFEEEFLAYRVPYVIVGGFRFYERREIKDALAFLQFWANPRSSLGLRRIAEALWRGIGPKTISRWEAASTAAGQSLEAYLATQLTGQPTIGPVLRAYSSGRRQSFSTVADLLKHLLSKSQYLVWLERQPDGEERQQNIDELLNVTATYAHPGVFLEEIALLADVDTLEREHDRVTCMTLHASKGLEFKHVFLVGCEEGLLPHVNSLSSAATLEEERRLLYVGMTRARQTLTIMHAATRFVRGELHSQLPSRFLEALPEAGPAGETLDWSNSEAIALTELQSGDLLQHPHFGRGVVVEVRGRAVSAVFEGYGLKEFDAGKLLTAAR